MPTKDAAIAAARKNGDAAYREYHRILGLAALALVVPLVSMMRRKKGLARI